MKRADAIARYGHHYNFSVHSRTVYESLGPSSHDDDGEHVTDEAGATEEMKDRLADAAMHRIAKIDNILERPGNRILMFLARRGWHKRSETILAAETRLHAERKELETDLSADFENKIKITALPDDIKLPVALDLGRSMYIVRACYLEEGIKMTEAKITDRRLWSGSSARGDWDYVFSYTATDHKGERLSFEYNRADESNPKIDNNYHGIHYFLTREAAEDFTLALAARLSAEFSKVAIDTRLRVIARPRPPEPPQP